MRRFAMLSAAAFALAACQEAREPTAPEGPSFSGSAGSADVIVVLKTAYAPGGHAANQARAAELARGLGVTPKSSYGTALFGFAATVPEARLNGLRNDPRVAYVDFDAPVSIPPFAAAPPCGVFEPCGGGSTGEVIPWGIKRIGADANTNEGTGVHVYIVDTGIDSDHPDLQAHLGNGFAVESCKGGSCAQPWDDDHDHGTHVAGTVGAIDNDIDVVGVASQVTLHAVKVLSKSGSGTRSGIITGLDWLANETKTRGQPSVANLSLGGSGSKTGTCTDSGFTGTDSYHAAFCNAKNVGVVFAVAAGNDGADSEGFAPAAYDDAVITASATQCSFSNQTCSSGTDNWPSWSNWGNNTASWTPHGSAPVGIAAPGVSVLSTKRGGGTTSFSGTSMASPHLAGGAALFLKSNAQSNNGTAFSNTRAALLAADESTDGWSNNSGNVHNEDFLKAGSL